MGIKHAYTATGTNDSAKQVSVDRWNESHVVDSEFTLPLSASPAVPASDNLNLFARKLAGRMMLSQVGPSGLDTSLQPHLGGNKVAWWDPPGGATTVPAIVGMSALTALGTATSRTFAATNLLTRMARLGYVSAGTAGSLAGAREAVAKYTTGAGGLLGGFFLRYRFAPSDAANVSGARMFVGLSASTGAPTNVEPTTLVNSIGVAQLSSSANLQIVWNGASATNAAIDLGASFPANTNVAVYELALFAPASGGVVHYQVTRLDTGAIASGSLTVNLPLSTVFLCQQLWRTNNTTAAAVGLDICGLYVETDY